MPEPGEILAGLGLVANRFAAAAVIWHVLLAAAFVLLLAGLRPSRRLGALLPLPLLLSVAVLALAHRNPFNGIVFLVFTAVLGAIAVNLPAAKARVSDGWAIGAGIALTLFGSFYPHFLAGGGWSRYLYAAPVGLIPCPTLSVTLGLTLIMGGFGSRAYSLCLAGLGLFYGLFGAFRLGVGIDIVLVGGATTLLVQAIHPSSSRGAPHSADGL